MDYEKAYKEALGRATALYKSAEPMSGCNVLLETVFPELQESEDEKIRKEITELVMQPTWKTEKEFHRRKELIDWLEKQVQGKISNEDMKEILRTEYEKGRADALSEHGICQLESQFKAGDWVVINGATDKIKYISKSGVECYNHWFGKDCITDIHQWTIKDAKDGDILSDKDTGHPCIYNGFIDEEAHPFSYCGVNLSGRFFVSKGDLPFITTGNVVPATKEQKEYLFKKMKESGYEWNSDTKELKQIEKNPLSYKDVETYKPRMHEAVCYALEQYRDVCNTETALSIPVNDLIDWVKENN